MRHEDESNLKKSKKNLQKIVLTLVQMSKIPNKTIRVLMLRFLTRAITTSGDEEASRPCDNSMAIGVYPGKRRGIYIRARHPRDERPIAPRSSNRTKENRTSEQRPVSARVGLFSTTRRASCRVSRKEEKRSEEKRSARHSRNAIIRSPDWPSEIDASSICTPTTRSQNLFYDNGTSQKKGIQANLGFVRRAP